MLPPRNFNADVVTSDQPGCAANHGFCSAHDDFCQSTTFSSICSAHKQQNACT